MAVLHYNIKTNEPHPINAQFAVGAIQEVSTQYSHNVVTQPIVGFDVEVQQKILYAGHTHEMMSFLSHNTHSDIHYKDNVHLALGSRNSTENEFDPSKLT